LKRGRKKRITSFIYPFGEATAATLPKEEMTQPLPHSFKSRSSQKEKERK